MPPRVVARRPGSGAGNFFVFAIFLSIGLVIAAFCIAEPLFLLLSPAIPGHVIGTESHFTSGRHGGWTYRIKFVYTENGRELSDRQTTSFRRFRSAHAGDPVQVHAIDIGNWHYDELDMTSGDYVGTRWFIWLWVLIWNGGILFILRAILITPRRLIRDGKPVIGQITGKQMVRGKSTSFYLKYTYQPEGTEPLNRQMSVNRSTYDQAVENTDVVVLYDPERPKRSLIYQYSPYQAL